MPFWRTSLEVSPSSSALILHLLEEPVKKHIVNIWDGGEGCCSMCHAVTDLKAKTAVKLSKSSAAQAVLSYFSHQPETWSLWDFHWVLKDSHKIWHQSQTQSVQEPSPRNICGNIRLTFRISSNKLDSIHSKLSETKNTNHKETC